MRRESSIYIPKDVGDGVKQTARWRLGNFLITETKNNTRLKGWLHITRWNTDPSNDNLPWPIFIHSAEEVIQVFISPVGSAQRFVWWNFSCTFPSILSQHLYVIIPDNTNSKLTSTPSSKPEWSCSMITLTGRWAVALWQHQRAPSAVWPVCAWKTHS